MKDIKGFCKLFDLSIPEHLEFQYYVGLFSKIKKFSHIPEMIPLFREAEAEFGDLREYRHKKADEIIQFLQSTRAFQELNDDNLLPDLPVTKNFQYSEEKFYFSVDMVSANWQILKNYDPPFLNELGDSYQEFLKKFGVPPVFWHSKQFRQYIFGNINPKRQIRAQRVQIQKVIDGFKSHNLPIEILKNDEVIWSFEDWNSPKEITQQLDTEKYKWKIFKVQRIDHFRINHHYDLDGNFQYKELVGCNGNLFFYFLKKYILQEPLDIRDLYFRSDGNLAIWKVDGLKVEL